MEDEIDLRPLINKLDEVIDVTKDLAKEVKKLNDECGEGQNPPATSD